MVLITVERSWSARPDSLAEARAHDTQIVSEVRTTLERKTIDWLRHHDFANSWLWARTDGLYELGRLDNVEHKPIDAKLAERLRALFDSTAELTAALTQHGFPDDRRGDFMNIGWSPAEMDVLEGDERELFDARRVLLNTRADAVAEAYDALIDLARQKLLL